MLDPVELSLGCLPERGGEDKCATYLVHQSQGRLVTKSIPRAACSSLRASPGSDFWLVCRSAVILWPWPLPTGMSSVPRAVRGRAFVHLAASTLHGPRMPFKAGNPELAGFKAGNP